MKIMHVLLVAALGLSACTMSPPPTSEHNISGEVANLPAAANSQVSRVTDPENGVVCYVSDGYKSGGISCIRIGTPL